MKRARVLYAARITSPSIHQQVKLVDISPLGARVDCTERLSVGEEVELARGGHSVSSRVVWAEGSCAGLEFAEPAPGLAAR